MSGCCMLTAELALLMLLCRAQCMHMIYKFRLGLLIYWLEVLDDRNVRRRFRASNMTSSTKVRPLVCTMPLKLTDGWNEIQINLVELTQRAYATHYYETTRLQVR